MRTYTLTHLSDAVLLRDLSTLVAEDRSTTAALLAHLAEVDARRLYLPAGYSSMFAYCVDELRLSEDAAYNRIQAARAARQFPALFTALADGRLHLTAARLLAPHLTAENLDELLAAATHQRKSEIERLLAQRFPRPDVPALVRALPARAPHSNDQLPPPEPSGTLAPERVALAVTQYDGEAAPGQVATDLTTALVPDRVPAPVARAHVAPLSPDRFVLRLTITKSTHDKLRHAQALLSHSIPSGDVAELLDRSLDALIGQVEKRKFAASAKPQSRPGSQARPHTQPQPQPQPRPQLRWQPQPQPQPRPGPQSTARKRHIPARVRRAVWERDRGQCTYVSESGHRCSARMFLEFDHADPVARGGRATVESMRIRCRAHNQYEAERTFGARFMSEKRHGARCAAAETRRTAGEARAEAGVEQPVAMEAGAAAAAQADAAVMALP